MAATNNKVKTSSGSDFDSDFLLTSSKNRRKPNILQNVVVKKASSGLSLSLKKSTKKDAVGGKRPRKEETWCQYNVSYSIHVIVVLVLYKNIFLQKRREVGTATATATNTRKEGTSVLEVLYKFWSYFQSSV